MEALEKDCKREVELVSISVEMGFPGRRALDGGGGMLWASAETVGGAAAFKVLDRPLVLRGGWALRKVASVSRAPGSIEAWLVSSTTSISEES